MRRERLVVVGAGMAGLAFLEALDPGRFAVTMVGAEPAPPYNRVLLSALLAGEIRAEEVRLRPAEWYAARGVELVLGDAATALDPAARIVSLASGRILAFDRLVLATGSEAIRLPVPGADLDGVVVFRDLSDVAAIERLAADARRAVVIGGGLLGLEAAAGLGRRGLEVSVIHLADRLMERQLDARAAAWLRRAAEARGLRVLLGAETRAFVGTGRVEGVALADGQTIPADLVATAVGTRPRAALARDAGLAVNRGIVVDDGLETSAPGIYAIGECAEHRGLVYGLVEPACEQARSLARRFGGAAEPYCGSLPAASLKVSDVPVFSAGMVEGGDEEIVLSDPGLLHYRKLVLSRGALAGCVLFGETGDGPFYLDLIRSGRPLGVMRMDLIFGRAFVKTAA